MTDIRGISQSNVYTNWPLGGDRLPLGLVVAPVRVAADLPPLLLWAIFFFDVPEFFFGDPVLLDAIRLLLEL